MTIMIKRLSNGAGIDLPRIATEGDAGYDLQAAIGARFIIPPGIVIMIPTGFEWEIPGGYVGMICPRSGMARNFNVTVANSPGIVDSTYRGEVCVLLANHGSECYSVSPGDRIAQMVIVPFTAPDLIEVSELGETDRGDGGFGSTGR